MPTNLLFLQKLRHSPLVVTLTAFSGYLLILLILRSGMQDFRDFFSCIHLIGMRSTR